ncbi:aminotransferase class V-fold PLP-dependent enzyme [Flavobacterium sp.]|uniref:aminotransferase class V-fold PLP-dependent enzyme n=1 Tax=Flavobacterium sp. TaxID=239 RepID=UPI002634B10D|nr:aminotransferase class V-fold PLP-dependent enzyme [Flavobacterium sp.]
MKPLFLLDPEITYLNHGSFGACPEPIFADYQYWQRELEKEPVQFITKRLPQLMQQSRQALADYICCDADDVYFVPNPTTAINTIMRNLDLSPGDEILSTDNEYGAMDRTWNFYCRKSGAKYVRQPISMPVISKEKLIEEFWKGYNSNTKVVFLNQISSATALIFPVKEICDRAQQLGLITIVDGAHVPGHIELDINALDPDFYTGTLHKWMLAPKGSSFLYVKKEFQDRIDPLIVSWGYDSESPGKSRFIDYHEFQGTRDMSAFLTTPAVVRFLEEHNWTDKSMSNKSLILQNYKRFCDLLKTTPLCPVSSEFLGQMCSVPVNTQKPIELKELLYSKYKIEVPITKLNGRFFLRISCQSYNSQQDIDTLEKAIIDILNTTDLIQ